ncbi:CBO0543 family protein [Priestia megaterium]|uniref:Uncharacterized protein n=1 Tax=Priestia megaterium TaxID=1404 RepID=A0A6M6DVV6_PRIMG|nr:CBO0543 family protein [Priestia megaterium]QJX77556.1 hypothetical protein FDZ14_15680 [Priestia megaterium]
MQSSFVLVFIILGLLFGKWRRYQEYYPTLLFWVTGNLLYEVLLFHHRVWVFHHVGIDHLFLPDHLMVSLGITLIIYPFVIPVFLGRLPLHVSGSLWWILLWALLFTVIEFIAYVNHSITHHYGWSLLCSFLFNIVTFSLLIIHQKTALAAWILSGSFIAFLFIFFDIPMP